MPRKLTRTLASEFPAIARELDEARSGRRADEMGPFTGFTAWWLCHRGHSWSRTVQSRTQDGQNCPFCAGHKAIPGETSFAAINPLGLLAEWDYERNTVNPDEILPGYTKKTHWACPEADDHRWEASPKMRTRSRGDNKPTGCPFCSGNRSSSTNNLRDLHPHLSAQWHPTKNDKRPEEVTVGSNYKAWWVCEVDHEYPMTVANRVSGQQCSICQRKRITRENGLVAHWPDVMDEWDWDANQGIDPELAPAAESTMFYWWKCRVDPTHTWEANTQNRGPMRFGCPYCNGTILTPALSLAVVSPRDAALLDTSACEYTADQLFAKGNKRLPWRCPVSAEHTWTATCDQQIKKVRSGCSYCEHEVVWSGYNLAVVYPTVAAEWHPSKNGDLRPTDVLPASSKTVWWQCAAVPTHEWKAKVTSRTSAGNGCRDCSKGCRVSIRELALRNMVALVFPGAHEGVIEGLGRFKNVDILIPEHNLVIEYDGAYYHRNREDRDSNKTHALVEAGYATFRVREEPLAVIGIDDLVLSYRVPLVKLGTQVIQHTLDLLGLTLPVPDEVELAAAADAAQREYIELCKLGQQRKAPHNRDGHKAA